MENTSNNYSHILQKAGVLKNFSVAKIVSQKELDDLKQLIKAVAKDKNEYNKMLAEELAAIGNMHDPKTPIPGIIYSKDRKIVLNNIKKAAKEYSTKMKSGKITKKELCILVASIIKELGLTHEDFLKLNQEESDDSDKLDDKDKEGDDGEENA